MRTRYLDPATGSYVIQMVVAGALAGAYAFKDFFAGLFGGGKKDEDPEEEETSQAEAADAEGDAPPDLSPEDEATEPRV